MARSFDDAISSAQDFYNDLVSEVQDRDNRIAELESENEHLQDRIVELESRIDDLESCQVSEI